MKNTSFIMIDMGDFFGIGFENYVVYIYWVSLIRISRDRMPRNCLQFFYSTLFGEAWNMNVCWPLQLFA